MTDPNAESEPQLVVKATAPKRHSRDEAADVMRDLLINRPLYAKVEGDDALIEAVDAILDASAALEFDLYCVTCGQVTP